MIRTLDKQRRYFYRIGMVFIILLGAFFRLHFLDSIPFGLYSDEAYNGLAAQRLIRNGHFPIFFPENGGREPLHIYFQAFSLSLFGISEWGLRVMSAFAGIVTIPIVYRLGQSLFKNMGDRSYIIGILAAASLAFSYWHISFSRIAFRAIYLLPFLTMSIWFFWRGWQGNRFSNFLLSGCALGVSLYTYLPARLLPIIFLLCVIFHTPELWKQANGRFLNLWQTSFTRGSVMTAVVALLVFFPLGTFYFAHPDLFIGRTKDVSIFSTGPTSTWEALQGLSKNAVSVLRMFVDQGDLQLRHNLPGRPSLNPIETIGFFIGVGLIIKSIHKPRSYLLLIWLLIMLLPTILAESAPHSLRAIGALPVVMILVGYGLSEAHSFVVQRRSFVKPRNGIVLLLLFVLLSSSLTYRAYFRLWAGDPEVATKFDVQEYLLAQQALRLLETDDIALPLELHNHPTFLFFIEPETVPLIPMESWLAERPVSLLQPYQHITHRLTLLHQIEVDQFAKSIPQPLNHAQRTALSELDKAEVLYSENIIGEEIKEIQSFLRPISKPMHSIDINLENFDNKVTLTGYSLTPRFVQPGKAVTLELYWQSQVPLAINYHSFAHLSTANYELIAKREQYPLGNVFPSSNWKSGDVIVDQYIFPIPDDAAPGKYLFNVGLVELSNGERLNLLNQDQEIVGDYIMVGAFTVIEQNNEFKAPTITTDVVFGEITSIQLLGYDINQLEFNPGESIDITLHWQANADGIHDYTIFIHVIDEMGNIVAQTDRMPGDGRYRTSLWFKDEIILDQHKIPLPQDLPPGQYQIGIGLYYWQTGERLIPYSMDGTALSDTRFILHNAIRIVD